MLRGLNFTKTVYKLFDNPSYTNKICLVPKTSTLSKKWKGGDRGGNQTNMNLNAQIKSLHEFNWLINWLCFTFYQYLSNKTASLLIKESNLNWVFSIYGCIYSTTLTHVLHKHDNNYWKKKLQIILNKVQIILLKV